MVSTETRQPVAAPPQPENLPARAAAPFVPAPPPPAAVVEQPLPPAEAAPSPNSAETVPATTDIVEAPPAPPPAPVSATPPAQTAAPNTHCLLVAKQRADDAAANGLDSATQQVVRDGTYANCMAWQAAHPQSQ
jgi:hypothetical protein